MTDTDRDQLIVAMTAYAEARSEGQSGIRAQVHSVINRHAIGKWYSGKTLADTCMVAYAYSAENTTDPNRRAAASVPMDDFHMQLCLAETEAAVAGTTDDPTDGATHYYADGTTIPTWADPSTGSVFTKQIGKHRFYKQVA